MATLLWVAYVVQYTTNTPQLAHYASCSETAIVLTLNKIYYFDSVL